MAPIGTLANKVMLIQVQQEVNNATSNPSKEHFIGG